MDPKESDGKNAGVVVIKKTRDTLIIQEGKIMRKYLLDREWEVKEKKEKKAKKGREMKKRNQKEKDQVNQVNDPKCAGEAPKCNADVESLTPHGIQTPNESEKNRMEQQELSCE